MEVGQERRIFSLLSLLQHEPHKSLKCVLALEAYLESQGSTKGIMFCLVGDEESTRNSR